MISSFGDGLGVARCNCPLTESEQQFQFVNNWTNVRGNHQIKFGADIRYAMNLRIPSDNNRTGEYNFSPEGTSSANAPTGTPPGGLDLGDLPAGRRHLVRPLRHKPTFPVRAALQNARSAGSSTARIPGVQRPKLTVNYGLRWEIYFPESVNAKGNGGFANIVDNGGKGGIRVAGFGKYRLERQCRQRLQGVRSARWVSPIN